MQAPHQELAWGRYAMLMASSSTTATGLGTKGANLMRLTFGTNYQVNSTTQWKTEYRLDQSSGYNFVNSSGTYSKDKQSMATSLVLSF